MRKQIINISREVFGQLVGQYIKYVRSGVRTPATTKKNREVFKLITLEVGNERCSRKIKLSGKMNNFPYLSQNHQTTITLRSFETAVD